MMFDALPKGTEALRAVIRPLPSQDPVGPTYPAVSLGPRADAYLEDFDVDPDFYLTLLRARLYSLNKRAFALTLAKDLGWKEDDADELWELIDIPGL